ALRSRLRRTVPAVAHGAAVVLLLAPAVSEHDGPVAAVPQPARLGRVRRRDLLHGFAAVLVRRPDPRPGDTPRPLAEPRRPCDLRYPGDGLARLGTALAPLRGRLPADGRPGDAAGRQCPHSAQLRLR